MGLIDNRVYYTTVGNATDGRTRKVGIYYRRADSVNSPRVNGELVLRANPYSLQHNRVKLHKYWAKAYSNMVLPKGADTLYNSFPGVNVKRLEVAMENRLYARLRGRLYEGNAALGVTAASYKQSADMIKEKSQLISRKSSEMLAEAATSPGRFKRLAGRHLEVIFGWQPLVSDIVASATSVIQKADQRQYITVRALDSQAIDTRATIYHTYRGVCSLTKTASMEVVIVNHNRWLLERAGLLNIGAVAWDLVPWSFLVNQFVNTGALVNSITDFSGLTFRNASVTTTIKGNYVETLHNHLTSYIAEHHSNYKVRRLGGLAPPRAVEFRLPNVSWEWAAMMTSLAVQNATKVLRLGSIKRAFEARKHL